jgi:hypothetical protein
MLSIVNKEEGRDNNPKNRILLIIFIAMAYFVLVIAPAALLQSYDLGQVAAQQAGSNNNAELSPSTLRQMD